MNRGLPLLQSVAERIIVRWLEEQGHSDVVRTLGRQSLGGRSVDITYTHQGSVHKIKVKADPYYGINADRVDDRSLPYYRADEGCYAFEAVANVATREIGWMLDSDADDLYYYYLAISQTEDEVRALADERDEVLISELQIDRDQLVIIPMRETRDWFSANAERFTPRPVLFGGGSGWYRLVPQADLEAAVPGIRPIGSVFRALAK